MNVNQRLPAPIQRSRKLPVALDIPDVDFMSRWVCCACKKQIPVKYTELSKDVMICTYHQLASPHQG